MNLLLSMKLAVACPVAIVLSAITVLEFALTTQSRNLVLVWDLKSISTTAKDVVFVYLNVLRVQSKCSRMSDVP